MIDKGHFIGVLLSLLIGFPLLWLYFRKPRGK